MPTLLHRLRAWLAQVQAVEPGKPNDGLVELSAGTERDKPWSELSREFSDALEAWRFNPLARRIVGLVPPWYALSGRRPSAVSVIPSTAIDCPFAPSSRWRFVTSA